MGFVIDAGLICRTGVEVIDDQHQHFARLVERLDKLSADLLSAQPGRALLDELLIYAEQHFRFEAMLMAESAYPGRAAHVAEHARILLELRTRTAPGTWDARARAALVDFVWHWFLDHTVASDKVFAEHYKQVEGRPVLAR